MARSALLCLLVVPAASGQSIFTFAGGRVVIDDGQPATTVGLRGASHVAVDSAGNLYIAETGAGRIRKVTAATGVISTVAGNGTRGFTGDGGPATSAALSSDFTMTVDSAGNLYISDTFNNRVRKVGTNGIISTIAGNGTQSIPSLFVTTAGDGGPATRATFYWPEGIAVDRLGNVYVVDSGDSRVRKVSAATGIITTVAGTSGSGPIGDGGPATNAILNLPSSLGIDGAGNLYVMVLGNNRIRKITAATGIITTVAGNGTTGFSGDGGPATNAALNLGSLGDLTVDSTGVLYFVDFNNFYVRKVAGGIISTVAGNGSSTFSGDGGPATQAGGRAMGIAVDRAGNLYLAGDDRIRKVAVDTGIVSTVAGNGTSSSFTGDGGAATSAILSFALFDRAGVATDSAKNLYIADGGHHRIRRVDSVTGIISTVAGNGSYGFSGDGGPAIKAMLNTPEAVAVDSAGNLYIADTSNSRIRKVSAGTGIISTVAGGGSSDANGIPATSAILSQPRDVIVDNTGNLYIADTFGQRVRKVDAATGIISLVAGNGAAGLFGPLGDGGPATAATLNYPYSVALDAGGNLYIADRSNHRVRKVVLNSGIISTVAGTGDSGFSGDGGPATAARIYSPYGVTVDSAGNLYIADRDNDRIRKVAGGIISTVAGGAARGWSGDGGPATAAGLAEPSAIAFDATGNVYIGDTASNRVRVVSACVTVAAPFLTSPASGATGLSTAPVLAWNKVDGALRHDVYVSTTNPPALIASDLTATTFTPSNLDAGATYYWKVVAKGDPFCTQQSTASSEERSFTTAAGCTAPNSFVLLQPADGASGIGSSSQLSWQSGSGAATFDVFFGPSNPPLLFSKGISNATLTVNGLTASTTYSWYVVAHAACDATKTIVSAVRSFQTAGSCAAAGTFSLISPPNGASNVSATPTLDWSSSANAASYDVYLGTTSPLPLYLNDVPAPRIAVAGFAPSRTYSWRIVAKVACDSSKNVSSATNTFTTAAACTVPGATTIVFVPPGNVAVGQTYTVAWQELPEIGSDGYYIVERSTSSTFDSVLDSQQSFSATASFITATAGTYYHRVRAVAGCDPAHPAPPSPVKSVNIIAASPNVIFTVQPQAVITAVGDKLEDQKTRFALENLGPTALSVIITKANINSTDFFDWSDPLGGDSTFVQLESRTPKSFDVHFHGPSATDPAAYAGIIVVTANGGPPLTITPYTFVNLKVGGGATSKPAFEINGNPTEYASFPGFAGNDRNRPPIIVNVRNDGSAPMELAAEIGPEVWVVPETGWNSSSIPAGASRPVKLFTQRSRAPNGSALPRYTYFTVRSKNGLSARLLVQDNDALPTALGRASLLTPGSRSFIVPGVVSAPPQFSRVRITNVGSDSVQTEVFFTPAGSDGFASSAVKRATVLIPPNDVVTLTDPLAQVFGLTAPAQGQMEIRAAPAKIGFLIVSSSVITPVTTGGATSYEIPPLLLGEGARLGSAYVIAGVAETSSTRTALTLVETSGNEQTRVRAILFGGQGSRKGDRLVDVPRYGQVTIANIVTALGGSEPFDAGRIDLNVESGGGAIAGIVTILDAVRNSGAVLVSQPASGAISSSSFARLQRAIAGAAGDVSVTAVAPVVVNGPSSTGGTRRTTMGFTATGGSSLTAGVTYRPSTPGASPIDKTLQLPSGVAVQFDNVLEDLFGIPKGQAASGAVFISAAAGSQIYARLATLIGSGWTVSSGLPLVPRLSDMLSSVASKHPLYLDGLEQSIDATRGTRWVVDINEVGGNGGKVRVRLYEAGNRGVPIAEKVYDIQAYQQLNLDTVFSALGLDTEERRKDRTNVLCVVSAESGNPVLSAVGVSIDNETGDIRHFVFSPTGGVPSTGVLRITTATPVLPPAPTGRHRAVNP